MAFALCYTTRDWRKPTASRCIRVPNRDDPWPEMHGMAIPIPFPTLAHLQQIKCLWKILKQTRNVCIKWWVWVFFSTPTLTSHVTLGQGAELEVSLMITPMSPNPKTSTLQVQKNLWFPRLFGPPFNLSPFMSLHVAISFWAIFCVVYQPLSCSLNPCVSIL